MSHLKKYQKKIKLVTTLLVVFGFFYFLNNNYFLRSFYQISSSITTRVINLILQPDFTVHEIPQALQHNHPQKYQDVFPGSNQSPLFSNDTIDFMHQEHYFPSLPTTKFALVNILNDLAPLAKIQMQAIPPDKLLEINPNLPPPHLTYDPSFTDKESKVRLINQLVIEKVLEKSGGLNTDLFYQDLDRTAQTHPWVFQHIKHYQQMDDAYMHLDPKIRAKEFYAHLGAVFGYNLLFTPLAPHYKGILKDPPSGNYNLEYFYATDPENIYKYNNSPGVYQSINYQPDIIWPLMYPLNSPPEQVDQVLRNMTPEDAKKNNFMQPFHKLNLELDQKIPTDLINK